MEIEQETDIKDLTGQKIDNYRIEKLLAIHKVSVRYLAQTEDDVPVLLEVLDTDLADCPVWADQFSKHMRLLTQQKHPNIAPIRHVSFPSNEIFYATLQPVDDTTLEQMLIVWRNMNFPPVQDALRLVRQLADALSSVQPAGIFHYDLQPENILLEDLNNPILLNLGIPISTLATPKKQNVLDTSEHIRMLDYVSPEEIYNEPLDELSNIYSLGIILYEILAGHRPYVPFSAWDIFDRASNPKEQPLEEVKPGLTRETYNLTKMCLWRQKWDRFDSYEDFIKAIDEALVAEEQKSISTKAAPPKISWQFSTIIILIIALVFAGIIMSRRDSPLVDPTSSPATAVPAIIEVPATNTVIEVPTETLVQATHIIESDILLLAPPQDSEFNESDTIYFDWYWPKGLETGQQFLVQIYADEKWHSVGTLDSPFVRSQYRLPVKVSTLNFPSGRYLWFVTLETTGEDNSLQSEQQSISIRISTPTATLIPVVTPTQSNLSVTQTRFDSCTPSLPSGWVLYTVQPNDYLFNLALATNTTVARLQEVNCLNGPALGVGMRLRLPSLPLATLTPAPASEIIDEPSTPPSGSSNPTPPGEVTRTPPPPP